MLMHIVYNSHQVRSGIITWYYTLFSRCSHYFSYFKSWLPDHLETTIGRKDARIPGMKQVSSTCHIRNGFVCWLQWTHPQKVFCEFDSVINWSNYQDFSNWVLKNCRSTLVWIGFLVIDLDFIQLKTKSWPNSAFKVRRFLTKRINWDAGSQDVGRCCTQRWLWETHRAQSPWLWNLRQTPPEVQNKGINGPHKGLMSSEIKIF